MSFFKVLYRRKISIYGNRLIEIEKDNDILLGVHINPCDEMWSLIINSLNKNKATYVVGDFNAYEKRGKIKNSKYTKSLVVTIL